MFLDEASVTFTSGKGGSGAVSFHREKHVPRGGPNGADGGRGGDVVLVADRNKRTLYDLSIAQHYEAQNGEHGVGNKRGKNGRDVEVKLPVGTLVTDAETGDRLIDMSVHGMRYVLCKGGKGGKGNQHYTSSVRQAPNFAQKGGPAERIEARLELKLIADVGLIGLPNAGKSTLISRISAARPKIGDYPFTTIVPNLGVVRVRDETFVVADMPGLIEGASEGIGLGHQFLRHVERNRVLVHVVDAFPIDGTDPVENYHLIEGELRKYSEEIYARPRLIALNKVDLVPSDEYGALRERFEALGPPLCPISGVTGQGIETFLDRTLEVLKATEPDVDEVAVAPTLTPKDDLYWAVEREGDDGPFRLVGKRLERMVAMTDLENDEALRYLHRRLERIGVIDELRRQGAQEGDEVAIGDLVFGYTDEQ